MQAFFVHATANGAGFTLNNSHREHNGAAKYLKNNGYKNNLIKLKVTKNNLSTYTVVHFNELATIGYDGNLEALQMFGMNSQSPQLYSITKNDNTQLSINSLPESSIDSTSVPLGIRSVDGGASSITLEEFNGFDQVNVYLEDLSLNEIINLRSKTEKSFDLAAGFVSDRFILHFNQNNAPVLQDPFGKQFADEDFDFYWSFDINVFRDQDFGDNITYTIHLTNGQDLPDWLFYHAASRTFSGNPKNSDVGIISLQLKATDMLGTSATYDFEIEVQNVNDPPYLQTPFIDMQTLEDQNFNFSFTNDVFLDFDQGDQLSYKATLANGIILPAWLSFNSETRSFSGIPDNNNVGIIALHVIATDSHGESVCDEFTLEIQNVNDAPELQNSIEDQSMLFGTDYLFYLPENTFRDIDEGDEITLSAKLASGEALPAWLSFDNTIGAFSGIAEQLGEFEIELIAMDKSDVTASTIFKLSVYTTTDLEKLGGKVFSIYPNPTNGKFYIKTVIIGLGSNYDLFIKDINGKSVYQGKLDSDKKYIDISGVSSGSYLIEIGDSKNKFTKTIIIKE